MGTPDPLSADFFSTQRPWPEYSQNCNSVLTFFKMESTMKLFVAAELCKELRAVGAKST